MGNSYASILIKLYKFNDILTIRLGIYLKICGLEYMTSQLFDIIKSLPIGIPNAWLRNVCILGLQSSRLD